MSVAERAITFDCEGISLFGVLAGAADPCGEVGVVIIVGGPQYRCGSHRQFVRLARRLAASGFPTLRFDYRGMGDSVGDGTVDLRSFEQVDADVAAAIGALVETSPVSRIVLWGLCDGASAALLYMASTSDRRIGGLVLVNPWARTRGSEARTRVAHYYFRRLLQGSFWRKLLSGQVRSSAARELVRHTSAAVLPSAHSERGGFISRMASGWLATRAPVMLLLSDNDYTAREFELTTNADTALKQALRTKPCWRETLVGADHTCSSEAAETAMHDATVRFLNRLSLAE